MSVLEQLQEIVAKYQEWYDKNKEEIESIKKLTKYKCKDAEKCSNRLFLLQAYHEYLRYRIILDRLKNNDNRYSLIVFEDLLMTIPTRENHEEMDTVQKLIVDIGNENMMVIQAILSLDYLNRCRDYYILKTNNEKPVLRHVLWPDMPPWVKKLTDLP